MHMPPTLYYIFHNDTQWRNVESILRQLYILGECTDNAARTKDKHQSDSEERHTRELHNYIASPSLYIATLYIIDCIPAHL